MEPSSMTPIAEIQRVSPAHVRTHSESSTETAYTTDESPRSSQAHVRSPSSASSDIAPVKEKRGFHSHSASTASDSSVTPLVVREKEKRESYASVWSDIEAQRHEIDDFSRKRFGVLRYTILTVYRRLFSLAFIGNAIAFIIIMLRGATPMDLVNASAVNLAVSGLCRHPFVINALFLTFGAVPRSAPMRLRRLACKIFHLGGVHSGTGVASCRDDLAPVDLLYPLRNRAIGDANDDRGKEAPPDPATAGSTDGYEVKGETFGVLPSDDHKFYYVKDMTPDEAMFIKCFDSWGEGLPGGKKGVAALTPHTAFIDPATPPGTKGRESIEVRCLVFYDE
ncbi:hypothetical protein VTH82DRAFT_3924 [Thermothelomyces myriococcoides]